MTTNIKTSSGADDEQGSDTGSQAPPTTVAPEIVTAAEQSNGAHGAETSGERRRRLGVRGRLYAYALATVALVSLLIVLAAANTAAVKVDWLAGTSRVTLVLLILVAAVLGWLLGLLTAARFHWRTQAPRR